MDVPQGAAQRWRARRAPSIPLAALASSKKPKQEDGKAARNAFRMEFTNLLQLALANRQPLGAYVVGSIPPEDKAVWDSLERHTGIKPELYERGVQSHGEQGLDQCLQVHMLRAINDYPEPQIVVLMTGD